MKRKRALDASFAAVSQTVAPPPCADTFTLADFKNGFLSADKLRAMPTKDKLELYYDRLLPRIRFCHPGLADKIMDMVFDCSEEEVIDLIYSSITLSEFVTDCVVELEEDGYYETIKAKNEQESARTS